MCGRGGMHGRGICAWGGACMTEGRACPRGMHAWGGGAWHRACVARMLPPVNKMTDACKNITLPQTSFAGGKYDIATSIPSRMLARSVTDKQIS